MSKLSIEFDQLRDFDTKALHGFESQVFAALATGVVFYILGWPSGESANVALLPSVSATGGGLLLGGKF